MIDKTTTKLWMKELKQSAIFLKSLYEKNEWNEKILFNCEKTVFLGFFSIRKMHESELLSNRVKDMNFRISKYPPKDNKKVNHKIITPQNFTEFYNLRECCSSQLCIKKIYNQFIHSAFFSPLVSDSRSFGFYFTSDYQSKKCIYYIPLIKVIEIFLSVANSKRIKLDIDIDKMKIKDFNKYID